MTNHHYQDTLSHSLLLSWGCSAAVQQLFGTVGTAGSWMEQSEIEMDGNFPKGI
jgi:hypothetical protein